MANNHQGRIDHGLAVICAVAEIARRNDVRAAVKFQFRQLDTFVHPNYREESDNKHIPRFMSTQLVREEHQSLLEEVRRQGMVGMCTPFDEESVAPIVEMGFDIIKVGSCSAKDWPLLEGIAAAGLPVIFSTGGLTIADIDNLVSFFEHRGCDFAIMHCVSIYPIPDEDFQLNQIDTLRRRYPGRTIGWSTHEDPDDVTPVAIAVAKGARIFERHVGIETDTIKLNAYSSTPAQIDRWLGALNKARLLCGATTRPPAPVAERQSLDSLRRGVYGRKAIRAGSSITREQVFFAMPHVDGQLDSGAWKDGIRVKHAVKANEPLLIEGIDIPPPPPNRVIKSAVHEVKALLNEARIALSAEFVVEYSHHHGMENFLETGAVLINCINREYCKKLLVQLPGQHHPSHFHHRKEETFQVLNGVLHLEIDGHQRVLRPGDTALVLPGVWHSFSTETGVVVEEVSTTHHNDDTVYADPDINRKTRQQRKTVVDHWGRYQVAASDQA